MLTSRIYIIPVLMALNKCDKVAEHTAHQLAYEFRAVRVSAHTGEGLEELRSEIKRRVFNPLTLNSAL